MPLLYVGLGSDYNNLYEIKESNTTAYGNDYSNKIDAIRSENTYFWESFPCKSAPAVSCGTPQDIQATGKDACSVATTGCSQDAAILVTLPPGAYTAIVRGVGGVTGVGLVGIDEIGP